MREGKASMTARRVAAQRASFVRVPGPGGRPQDDQALQVDVAAGLEGGATELTRYLRARTWFFDRVVVEALAAGATQVVVVGAGYDGRSLRYAAPGVRWFELDHPATQADKVARLTRLGVDTSGVVFAPADFLVDDVAAALAAAGHDAGVPTLFTCEGVVPYLGLDAVVALLRTLRAVAAPASTLAVEVPLDPETDEDRARRGRLHASVDDVGEPLVTSVPRAALAGVLRGAGWAVVRATDPTGVDVATSTLSTAFVLARPTA